LKWTRKELSEKHKAVMLNLFLIRKRVLKDKKDFSNSLNI